MPTNNKISKRERINAYMREYNQRPEVKAQIKMRRALRREKIFNEFINYLNEMED